MPDNNSNNRSDRGLNESGYSIPLGKDEVVQFFEEGDFASGSYLNLFENVGSELNDRIKNLGGASFLALSVTEERISRDFSVLQIAHYLTRLDRSVLIVDCDFLEPGLGGMVNNIEEYGFLDLLLYGSSLKSVAKPSGIDNLGIIGPGSFPVTKTVPFARKEFKRINDFLLKNSDAVIYCSTLNTDEGEVNPLSEFVDGIILSCRIEETEEGQLQKSISALESIGVTTIETVCLCRDQYEGVSGPEPEEESVVEEEEASAEELPEEQAGGPEEQPGLDVEEEAEPAFIEKTEELDSEEGQPKKKFDVFRLGAVIVGVLVIAFVVWWFMVERGIEKEDRSREIKSEAVRKMKDVREEMPEEERQAAARDYVEDDAEATAGETGSKTTAAQAADSSAAGGPVIEEEPVPEGSAREFYSIHVASFRDLGRAQREKEYFEGLGYQVTLKEAEIKEQQWYRIMIGRYETEDEAKKKRIELKGIARVGYARVRKIEID